MRFRRRNLFGLALAAVTAFATLPLAAQEMLSVHHAQGETQVSRNPQRVLVYDPVSLDTLTALGIRPAGVAQFSYPASLSAYAGADHPKVGSLFEPDLEAANALHPDLIIVGGRSAAKLKQLSQIAPTIDMTIDPAHFLAGAEANARTLGEIFGKEAEVEARLARLDASVAALHARATKIGIGLVVLTTGTHVSAFGPGSRFGIVHSAFGIAPAAPHLTAATHGEAVSFEFILKTNPDWLFVIDRDAAIGRGSAEKILDNPLVAATTAWKTHQVVQLDPARWYLLSGGLREMQESVDHLSAAIARKKS